MKLSRKTGKIESGAYDARDPAERREAEFIDTVQKGPSSETDPAYEGIEFKEVDRVRKVHRKKHYFLRFLITCGIIAAVIAFLRSDYFAVEIYEVEGNHYYTDEEVLNIAQAPAGNNVLFDLQAGDIKNRLSKDPYFASVEVKRKLPRTVVIKVEERVQTAAFLYGDSYVVIDSTGLVLRKSDKMPELPILDGLTITKMNVGEQLEVAESSALTTTLQMLEAMQKGDIYFKRITMGEVIIRCYIYDTLIVKGSPAEITRAIESEDLQKVVTDLFSKGITRGTIKMGGTDYISFTPEIDG